MPRDRTLLERGLDFRQAGDVFACVHLTRADDRRDYGEARFIMAHLLRMAARLEWTC